MTGTGESAPGTPGKSAEEKAKDEIMQVEEDATKTEEAEPKDSKDSKDSKDDKGSKAEEKTPASKEKEKEQAEADAKSSRQRLNTAGDYKAGEVEPSDQGEEDKDRDTEMGWPRPSIPKGKLVSYKVTNLQQAADRTDIALQEISRKLAANELLVRSTKNMSFADFQKLLWNLQSSMEHDSKRVASVSNSGRNEITIRVRMSYQLDEMYSILKKSLSQVPELIVLRSDQSSLLQLKKPCQAIFNQLMYEYKQKTDGGRFQEKIISVMPKNPQELDFSIATYSEDTEVTTCVLRAYHSPKRREVNTYLSNKITLGDIEIDGNKVLSEVLKATYKWSAFPLPITFDCVDPSHKVLTPFEREDAGKGKSNADQSKGHGKGKKGKSKEGKSGKDDGKGKSGGAGWGDDGQGMAQAKASAPSQKAWPMQTNAGSWKDWNKKMQAEYQDKRSSWSNASTAEESWGDDVWPPQKAGKHNDGAWPAASSASGY